MSDKFGIMFTILFPTMFFGAMIGLKAAIFMFVCGTIGSILYLMLKSRKKLKKQIETISQIEEEIERYMKQQFTYVLFLYKRIKNLPVGKEVGTIIRLNDELIKNNEGFHEKINMYENIKEKLNTLLLDANQDFTEEIEEFKEKIQENQLNIEVLKENYNDFVPQYNQHIQTLFVRVLNSPLPKQELDMFIKNHTIKPDQSLFSKTKEESVAYFHTHLSSVYQESLKQIVELRKNGNKFALKLTMWFIAIALTIILGLFFVGETIFILVGMFIGLAITWRILSKPAPTLKEKTKTKEVKEKQKFYINNVFLGEYGYEKKEILEPFFSYVFPSFSYKINDSIKIEDVYVYGLCSENAIDRVYGYESLVGMIKDNPVRISETTFAEVTRDEDGHTSTRRRFVGLVGEWALPYNSDFRLIVTKKDCFASRSQKKKEGLVELNLAHAFFNENYIVLTNNEIKAKALLTPYVVERIVLSLKEGSIFSIHDGNLVVGHPMYQSIELFQKDMKEEVEALWEYCVKVNHLLQSLQTLHEEVQPVLIEK